MSSLSLVEKIRRTSTADIFASTEPCSRLDMKAQKHVTQKNYKGSVVGSVEIGERALTFSHVTQKNCKDSVVLR